MGDKIVHVTDSSFDEDVLKSDKPVLVDYWAEWCGPCKMIAPILDEVAGSYNGKLQIAKVNVDDNRAVVHGAWRLHYDNIMHSLRHAYYQGWDLNPGQLPVRYAAVDTFFLSGLQDASARLNAFLNKAAQATLVGNTFDDAATGQGLLNFFLRGLACGAITEQEVLAAGITLEELRSRSFVRIVNDRARK